MFATVFARLNIIISRTIVRHDAQIAGWPPGGK
jgi:hypothetical protein